MANIRAQVVFQGFTNTVADRYVHTFHFSNLVGFSTHRASVHNAIVQFYTGTATGGSTGPGANLSPLVSRTVTINCYDLQTSEPRIPTVSQFTLPTAVATNSLPQELAACLSIKGALPIHPRRRGRIYFGPLANHADNIGFGTSVIFPFVGSILRQRLVEHAKDLRNDGAVGWAILSKTPFDNFVPVDSGHVDDAWDIQRRRGHETTLRTPFSASLP